MENAVSKLKPVPADRNGNRGTKSNPYASATQPGNDRDWSLLDVDSRDLQLLLAACIAAGDAVMFSASKKGPVIGLTVYHDGEPTKLWANNPEAMSDIIEKVTRLALQQLPSEVAAKLTT